MTMDSGAAIRFATHKVEARDLYNWCGILDPAAFDKVWWEIVYATLHSLPKMFTVWACKQVFNYAATFYRLNQREEEKFPSAKCPCCTLATETMGHVLLCQEEGRTKLLIASSATLLHWMLGEDTERDLTFLIIKFIRDRGETTMEEICMEYSLPQRFLDYAKDQGEIGWRRFMEGMVASRLEEVLNSGELGEESRLLAESWTKTLVR